MNPGAIIGSRFHPPWLYQTKMKKRSPHFPPFPALAECGPPFHNGIGYSTPRPPITTTCRRPSSLSTDPIPPNVAVPAVRAILGGRWSASTRRAVATPPPLPPPTSRAARNPSSIDRESGGGTLYLRELALHQRPNPDASQAKRAPPPPPDDAASAAAATAAAGRRERAYYFIIHIIQRAS
jgi:hypothetical protein